MKVAVLGTGGVGQTIGSKLVELGHEVTMGSRSADNEDAVAWAQAAGAGAAHGTFADAAASGEIVFNCTAGGALARGAWRPRARTTWPARCWSTSPTRSTSPRACRRRSASCNDDSLGEQIQRAHPDAKVVKALNTVNCRRSWSIPARSRAPARSSSCGNDAEAKDEVARPAARASAGPRTRSSTSATSTRPAGLRCTCRCGCG